MSSTLTSLPPELLYSIALHLRPNELSNLLLTAKAFGTVERLLWHSVEPHPPKFHGQRDSASSSLRFHVDARFAEWGIYQLMNRTQYKTERFFGLATMRITHPSRWRQIQGMVRHLCVSVGKLKIRYEQKGGEVYWVDVFDTILGFVNLESVHVFANVGEDLSGEFPVIGAPDPTWSWRHKHTKLKDEAVVIEMEKTEVNEDFSKLRDVKLRGHVPKEFVQKLMRVAHCVKHLNLGLLDSVAGYAERENYQPRAEDIPKALAPRALGWLPGDWVPNFQMLTTLCLSKPSDPHIDGAEHEWDADVVFDRFLDELVLQEWTRIIRLVRNNIVDLTFDLLELGPYADLSAGVPNRAIPGTERFCRFIVPALLEENDWPALRRLVFRGVNIRSSSQVGVAEELSRKFCGVDIQHTRGRYMIVDEDCGNLTLAEVDDGLGLIEDGQLEDD